MLTFYEPFDVMYRRLSIDHKKKRHLAGEEFYFYPRIQMNQKKMKKQNQNRKRGYLKQPGGASCDQRR